MLFILICVLSTFIGMSMILYALGMRKYAKNNIKSDFASEIESIRAAIIEEKAEMNAEVPLSFAWWCERHDIAHLQARMRLLSSMSFKEYKQKHNCVATYLPLFWKAPLTTFKFSWRYLRYGCIRSRRHHMFVNKDHVC